MGLNLGPGFHELDPIMGCVGDSCISCPPLRKVQYLAEVYSLAVSVMERLIASVDVRPSAHSTSLDRCAYWGANGCDLHPWGGDQKNESECVKGVENGSDCERSSREGVLSRMMLRSKEGCANGRLNESVNDCDRVDHESVHDRHRR